jgi:aryl-alcohol dehydrogenase-like predicted oxidoreductase
MKLSKIGIGCRYFGQFPTGIVYDIVKSAIDNGINWFDTAEYYKGSEEALRNSLYCNGQRADEVFIATKWFPMFRTASNIIKTIGDRTKKLNPYPISLYQIHHPLGFSSTKKEMGAMAILLKSGQIRNIGVCNYSVDKMICAWEVLQRSGIRLFSNQVKYNLLDREIENNGLLEVSKELGIAIIAHSPLELGILTGKFHKHPELLDNIGERKRSYWFKPEGIKKSEPVIKVIENLCKKYNVTASQIALSWLIHHKSVFAIPGATSGRQAIENAVAMKFKMSEKDYKLLDGLK